MTITVRLHRFLLVVVGLLALVVLTAGPVAAHAVVVSSSPGDREQLPTAPQQVQIVFSEDVTTVGPGLQVVDGAGARVSTGAVTQPEPRTLAVALPEDLGDGSYVASYRIISADGHPVSGAIVFGVGSGGSAGLAAATPTTGDPGWELFGALARFVMYTAALLAAGGAFFLAFLDDVGPEERVLFRLVRWSAPVAAVGVAGVVLAQTALATGEGLGSVTDVSLVRQALVSGLGWNVVVLLIGLAALLVALELRGVPAQVLVFYGSVTTCLSFALWGHAAEGTNRWLAMIADGLHVLVAAIWFGGLVALTLTLRARVRAARLDAAGEPVPAIGEPVDTAAETQGSAGATAGATATAVLDRPAAIGGGEGSTAAASVAAGGGPDQVGLADESGALHRAGGDRPDADHDLADPDDPDPYETGRIVARFSTTAAISVLLLAGAGLALAWTQLGTITNLISTTYGQVLLAKVAVAVLVGGVAVYNNQVLLPRLGDEEEDFVQGQLGGGPAAPAPGWDRLVRTARLEALGLVVVLALTGVLVNLVPGRSGDTPAGPFNQTQTIEGGNRLNLVVSPALVGTNNLHLTYSTPAGTPLTVASSQVQMSLPDKGIEPITRPLQPAGAGHFILDASTDLAVPGTWSIVVETRVNAFTAEVTTFSVPITPP